MNEPRYQPPTFWQLCEEAFARLLGILLTVAIYGVPVFVCYLVFSGG